MQSSAPTKQLIKVANISEQISLKGSIHTSSPAMRVLPTHNIAYCARKED